MALYRIGKDEPVIPASAYVAKEATIIGRVKLGEFASVWPGAVIRGDDEPIHVGDRTNVQDGAVLHTDPGCPLIVGRRSGYASSPTGMWRLCTPTRTRTCNA